MVPIHKKEELKSVLMANGEQYVTRIGAMQTLVLYVDN